MRAAWPRWWQRPWSNRGRWRRLFRLAAGSSPVEHVYMPVGGAYLPTSTINQVTFIGQDLALATYPNGRAANIANLVRVDLATGGAEVEGAGETPGRVMVAVAVALASLWVMVIWSSVNPPACDV